MPGVGVEGLPVSLWERLRIAFALIFTPGWRLLFAAKGKVTAINPPDLGEGWSEVECEAQGGLVKQQFPTIRLISIGADEPGAPVEYRHYAVGAYGISILRSLQEARHGR